MATNIYVGNLPWSTTEDDLYTLFQQYGTVQRAQIVTDRETGRSRGFAFVEMPNDAEAQAAIAALNEQPMNGRPLTVNVAQPRQERGPAAAGTAAVVRVAAAAAGTVQAAAGTVAAAGGTATAAGTEPDATIVRLSRLDSLAQPLEYTSAQDGPRGAR